MQSYLAGFLRFDVQLPGEGALGGDSPRAGIARRMGNGAAVNLDAPFSAKGHPMIPSRDHFRTLAREVIVDHFTLDIFPELKVDVAEAIADRLHAECQPQLAELEKWKAEAAKLAEIIEAAHQQLKASGWRSQ